MGLFFYTKIGSIIFIGDLPTTNIIEPKREGFMTFSFCDMDYSESAVEKKKKVNKTML